MLIPNPVIPSATSTPPMIQVMYAALDFPKLGGRQTVFGGSEVRIETANIQSKHQWRVMEQNQN